MIGVRHTNMDSLIIKDIYSKLDKLNDGDIGLSDKTIEETGEAIKEVIKQWSSPQPSTKFTISDAVQDLKAAFKDKLLINTLNNDLYFNIKKMNNLNLK